MSKDKKQVDITPPKPTREKIKYQVIAKYSEYKDELFDNFSMMNIIFFLIQKILFLNFFHINPNGNYLNHP
jgi:hypothetical protein